MFDPDTEKESVPPEAIKQRFRNWLKTKGLRIAEGSTTPVIEEAWIGDSGSGPLTRFFETISKPITMFTPFPQATIDAENDVRAEVVDLPPLPKPVTTSTNIVSSVFRAPSITRQPVKVPQLAQRKGSSAALLIGGIALMGVLAGGFLLLRK